MSYFAVFDGHGGARASQFAAENLHHTLAKKFPTGEFPPRCSRPAVVNPLALILKVQSLLSPVSLLTGWLCGHRRDWMDDG